MIAAQTRQKALEVVAGARGIIKAVAPYLDAESDSFSWVFCEGIGETFACDEARRIYCDPEYLIKVGPGTVAADFLHEIVVHTMGDHFKRARKAGVSDMLQKAWNMAGDAAGNHIVREIAAISQGRITPGNVRIEPATQAADFDKSGWVTAKSLGCNDGDTVEVIFQKILDQQKDGDGNGPGPKPPPPRDPTGPEGNEKGPGTKPPPGTEPRDPQDGEPQDGEGDGEGDGEPTPIKVPPNYQPPKPPPGKKPKECGGCAGDKQKTDKLREAAEAQGESIPKERSALELEGIKQATAQKIKEAAGRGNVPGGIKRWAEEATEPPKVDWRRELPNLVKRGLELAKGKVDFTFAKTKKRAGVILPTMASFKPRVAMVFDTSGSMGDKDVAASVVEGVGLVKKAGVTDAWIIACDTVPTAPTKMKGMNAQSIKDVLAGGGGTDMGAGIRAAAKTKPHVTVVFTDLDTGWPDVKPDNAGEVIIVGVRKSNCPTPEWARKVLDASK
jgi:hypothetical protein